jgi:DNA-binding response OmpR family regulator
MTDQARILIIAHEEDVKDPLRLYFTAEGTEVLLADSMQDGIQQASKNRPDIILLAATVGRVDGIEIFRRLRKIPLVAHIPVMFIADFRDAQRQNDLLAEGADDVIVQPFDVEILALRVRNAIQRTRREGLTDSITNLPIGVLLKEQLAAAASDPQWERLDLTLKHFEAFRARYDFITGNEVLRYAANAISEIVAADGGARDFVGYVDEAHFVILTDSANVAALTDLLKTRVGEGLLQFYNFMEREQGFVQIDDGRGNIEERPLMQVEIAAGE